MSDDKTITLGGRDFPIAPLTLGQMRQAGPAFMRIGIESPEGIRCLKSMRCLFLPILISSHTGDGTHPLICC